MSFTCPDCLWTSQSTKDERDSYCGHCHEPKTHNFCASSFQRAVFGAARPTVDEDLGEAVQRGPIERVHLVIAQFRMMQLSLGGIYADLTRMLTASKITDSEREALQAGRDLVVSVANTTLGGVQDPIG